MTDRTYIEKALARQTMSPEAKAKLAEATRDVFWRIRCWSCGTEQEVQLEHIGACKACGKPLGVRE